MDPSGVDRIANFEESRPSNVLGPRPAAGGPKTATSVTAYAPGSVRVRVRYGTREVEMRRVDPRGAFAAVLAGDPGRYVLVSVDESGKEEAREDPYSFGPTLGDLDLHLLAEGTHRRSYEKLGAHAMNREGVEGVQFAVWAPNAMSVAVVGDFNRWVVGAHPMEARGSSGVWELFVPRMKEGQYYKFAVRSRLTREVALKTDPYAFRTELRPRTAAVVASTERFAWEDGPWLRARGSLETRPVSVYEVHLGSWRRERDGRLLTYREAADRLVPYVKEMGFTHVELLPVMEHPLDDSWGYQVVNYYAPTSRYGAPADLAYFVNECHKNGIGVILDWVPAHFPKDAYGLALFDGSHLYEHSDPRLGEQPDWGTLVFNYGRNEVRTFLVSNALFWLDRYHIDGLRFDAVASMLYLDYSRRAGGWVPNRYGGRENLDAVAFLREVNDAVHSGFPGVLTIAEESTSWPGVTRPTAQGGLGFDLKWNMGWMHDTLEYFSRDPLYRRYHQNGLTFSLWYAFSERFVLVLSHDEVVYGKRSMLEKMPGDDWQKFANLRLCYGYMFFHPGKKMLFMGDEFGQRREWDFRSQLDWGLLEGSTMHEKLRHFVKDLNAAYHDRPELWERDGTQAGFEWVDFNDNEQSVLCFLRRSGEGTMLAVCNMTPVPRHGYRVGVPLPGRYREVLNSDASEYGGSGVGNLGGVTAEPVPCHGRPFSVRVTLPPLAIDVFSAEGVEGP